MSRLLVGLVLLVGLHGCGGSASSKNLVGTWQQTNSETRVGTEVWQPATDAACRSDNTEVYEANGTWTLFDGANQCGSGASIVHGAWRLAAADTKIVYTYDGSTGEYESTIESLTDATLILSYSTGTLEGQQVRSTFSKR